MCVWGFCVCFHGTALCTNRTSHGRRFFFSMSSNWFSSGVLQISSIPTTFYPPTKLLHKTCIWPSASIHENHIKLEKKKNRAQKAISFAHTRHFFRSKNVRTGSFGELTFHLWIQFETFFFSMNKLLDFIWVYSKIEQMTFIWMWIQEFIHLFMWLEFIRYVNIDRFWLSFNIYLFVYLSCS